MDNFNKESKYLRAKERVEILKKFYSNLMSYVVFISVLAGLNYYTNQWSHPWFLWAAFGWGIGIIFHAIKAFNWVPFMNRDWEDRKIKEFMNDEDTKPNNQWK
ncbi:MAG: 2TM domain-containing protein [Flavobacteriaceae bacterium]